MSQERPIRSRVCTCVRVCVCACTSRDPLTLAVIKARRVTVGAADGRAPH